ncbi:DUF5955 family protein [Actinomadura macrotermitis]|uniref:DUF4404 family protein n=1 Tax=Actinomadura macrotermitis TaxID=2585200 RepID=A0A7K0BTF4_9ACTN|nr:DUF5955 family protein [Actinomadura macrotermitis]MQY04431.1 hypothetical protein [Actinomadura macrotermitis]
MSRGDRGISIGGHASVSGQVASGDHVIQRQESGAAPRSDAFAEVERLIGEHAAALPEAERARRDLADLRSEAAEADPDTERMQGALERLARRVSGVAVLAAAVHDLAGQLGLG